MLKIAKNSGLVSLGEHHPWCVAGNNREKLEAGNGVFIQKRQKSIQR